MASCSSSATSNSRSIAFVGPTRPVSQARAETPSAGRLPLCRNFRSQPAILQFVNSLFCEVFYAAPGADASDELIYEPLVPHRSQHHAGPAIEFMWCLGEPSTDKPAENYADEIERSAEQRESTGSALHRQEADWIARRIIQLLDGESPDGPEPLMIQDKSSPQPRLVRKGDIAILFRSLSDVSYYEDALRVLQHRLLSRRWSCVLRDSKRSTTF